jgi:transposase
MTPPPEQVWVVVNPVDCRLGIDGLSLKIQQSFGRSPCDGSAYAFRNRRSTRLKMLARARCVGMWDGNGVWLCQRRLHRGVFVWPKPGDADCTLTAAQWAWLIAGVDWRRLSATALTGKQV